MVRIIEKPRIIPAAGTPSKTIEEYIGNVASGTSEVSIARMISPSGWSEPFQTPEFDEYTLVIHGILIIETEKEKFIVNSGQAIFIPKGTTVRYQTPKEAEYLAVCLPAFSPETVHRVTEDNSEKKSNTTIKTSYHIISTGPEDIDRIEPMWKLLRDYIIKDNHLFTSKMKKVSFKERKKEIIRRNEERQIMIYMAVDDRTSSDIGYCLCSAASLSFGEIESIFIRDKARNMGIGTCLMKMAIIWMKKMNVTDIRVHVTVGNEGVIAFYQKFGFYPRQYILENCEDL
ncbi:MAG: GNAT family N-acetyltransferase [Methanomicrobiales archaeon]|nr:GNAT family N-acetyltransferase [Methanomicrobiales archaeon]